jgi:hypothetical protein
MIYLKDEMYINTSRKMLRRIALAVQLYENTSYLQTSFLRTYEHAVLKIKKG